MPNHVINYLTIDCEDITPILEFIRGEDSEQFIDFNKISPMPLELESTTSPTRVITEEEFKRNQALGIDNGITQEMKDSLMKKYLAANWYDWRLQNWGTKWNAYDQSLSDNQIVFQTAWNTPVEVIEKLSALFPDALFTLKYADEDLGHNCGEYQFQQGESDKISGMEGSEDAIEFANELWGNY